MSQQLVAAGRNGASKEAAIIRQASRPVWPRVPASPSWQWTGVDPVSLNAESSTPENRRAADALRTADDGAFFARRSELNELEELSLDPDYHCEELGWF